MINLITHNNGVGLSTDYKLIAELLQSNNIDCKFWELREHKCNQANINIHLELVDPFFFRFAPVNILIPNPEWFFQGWIKFLPRFNYVFAKTHDCERIFNAMTDRIGFDYEVIYTSFTSPDMRIKSSKYDCWFHLRGNSSAKNTDLVYKAFQELNKPLIIVGDVKLPKTKHIQVIRRLERETLKQVMNECLFHCCPSQYEGFGHYINEARSVGSIILTTNAPPMNELCKGTVMVANKQQANLGILNTVDLKSLKSEILRFSNFDSETIKQEMKENRKNYLENDKFFKNIFLTQVKQILNK
jgi:hypothetical protein